MAKKIQSVEELYGSQKAGAGPLIWILTILFLLCNLGILFIGTPLVRQAFVQYPGERPNDDRGEMMPYVATPTPEPEPSSAPADAPTKEPVPTATATAVPEVREEEQEEQTEPTTAPTPFLRPYISPSPVPEEEAPTETPRVFLQPAVSPTPEGSGDVGTESSAMPEAEELEVFTQPEVSGQPEVSPEASIEPETTPAPEKTPDNQMRTFASIPDVVEAVSPAVVGIVNYQKVTGYPELMAVSSGSGFVVSEDGYILTNAHVVSGAVQLEVLFEDGSSVWAQLVGRDIPTDIALLKIEKEGLTVLPMGNSDYIRPGEYVLAIGNPLDSYQLYGTVTFGIISAVAREINIEGYVNSYLQTDAAINLGNSGGPLVNLNGQVVGMNTAKSVVAGYDENGNAVAAEGIGFALPINMVIDIANKILIEGGVSRPGVGLQVQDLSEASARLNGLVPGVLVSGVTVGGPAEQAGLQVNDVIVKLNGEALTDRDVLVSFCQSCAEGDSMTLTIYRNGQYLDVVLVVGNINDFSD